MLLRNLIILCTAILFCFAEAVESSILIEQELASLQPYLLDETHPLKKKLDLIFTRSRPIYDDKSLTEAGFKILYNQPRSFIRVIKHSKLRGVLIKANLDTDLRKKQDIPGWRWFLNRCIGAQKIAEVIEAYGIRHFTVPRKWIYVLPKTPYKLEVSQTDPKPVVLVVENMHLVSKRQNYLAWKRKITKRHLRELYTIMTLAGGSSYRACNIWLTREGKFAFIDTEYPDKKPNYKSISPYLNRTMQKYWKRITKVPRQA